VTYAARIQRWFVVALPNRASGVPFAIVSRSLTLEQWAAGNQMLGAMRCEVSVASPWTANASFVPDGPAPIRRRRYDDQVGGDWGGEAVVLAAVEADSGASKVRRLSDGFAQML